MVSSRSSIWTLKPLTKPRDGYAAFATAQSVDTSPGKYRRARKSPIECKNGVLRQFQLKAPGWRARRIPAANSFDRMVKILERAETMGDVLTRRKAALENVTSSNVTV
jgi:hypothetical protein